MPSRKSKKAKSSPAEVEYFDIYAQDVFFSSFPFSRYVSVVGVHNILLVFVALFIPRTPMLVQFSKLTVNEAAITSKDRPQHPFLEDLTISPIVTVGSISVGVVILQAWWAGWLRHWWWMGHVEDKTDDEKRAQVVILNKSKIKALGNASMATVFVSFILHICLVLLGAPFLSHVLETYTLSFLLAVLSVFPPLYAIGCPPIPLMRRFSSRTDSTVVRFTWVRLFAELNIRTPVDRALVLPAAGAIIGAWLGAIPMALDWDRPWQAYPLTPAFGAIVGYVMCSFWCVAFGAMRLLAREEMLAKKIKTA